MVYESSCWRRNKGIDRLDQGLTDEKLAIRLTRERCSGQAPKASGTHNLRHDLVLRREVRSQSRFHLVTAGPGVELFDSCLSPYDQVSRDSDQISSRLGFAYEEQRITHTVLLHYALASGVEEIHGHPSEQAGTTLRHPFSMVTIRGVPRVHELDFDTARFNWAIRLTRFERTMGE
ncbi:Hypothetical predicted protein [Cloeon dipterum]|uniref:Uncharacterized protein n=1 Tax=Cloeon dipterum TaxID=197152 RepID=A0A8S1E8L1_9INSE|nr:Hypothetical predicted protein [Cloeon dipterum]